MAIFSHFNQKKANIATSGLWKNFLIKNYKNKSPDQHEESNTHKEQTVLLIIKSVILMNN